MTEEGVVYDRGPTGGEGVSSNFKAEVTRSPLKKALLSWAQRHQIAIMEDSNEPFRDEAERHLPPERPAHMKLVSDVHEANCMQLGNYWQARRESKTVLRGIILQQGGRVEVR